MSTRRNSAPDIWNGQPTGLRGGKVARTILAAMLSYLNKAIGVRQCGKTTLLGTLPQDWRRFDLERRADHQVVSRDPDAFFRFYPRRVAIDETQSVPEVFPALRVAIDAYRQERGRFVITGSSSPC